MGYSALNYKDGLALSGHRNRVARRLPMAGGIDLAGTVVVGLTPLASRPLQAMAVGTAGYTAALCVNALEQWRQIRPGHGKVIVTGAGGSARWPSLSLHNPDTGSPGHRANGAAWHLAPIFRQRCCRIFFAGWLCSAWTLSWPPLAQRRAAWNGLTRDLDSKALETISTVEPMSRLPQLAEGI